MPLTLIDHLLDKCLEVKSSGPAPKPKPEPEPGPELERLPFDDEFDIMCEK